MANRQATAPSFVAYYRVSTRRQARSGLGMEAQRAAVEAHVAAAGGRMVGEHTEVESGGRNDRPVLAEALAACRVYGAVLLVARIDRLARNVHFISGLMESGVEFAACDLPVACKLTVHVMAAMAEQERALTSERTRDALAAAKRRGVRLGRPENMGAADMARGRVLGREARTRAAAAWAADVLPMVREIQAAGVATLRGVAEALNRRGAPARRGGAWSATQVARVLATTTD